MRSPASAEISRKCGTEGCASGVVTEAEGVCAQSVKAEKSRTKETEVRVLILSGILALHCACQAIATGPIEASCSLHISRFHFLAVLLEDVQPVLVVPIEGADTRIKDGALQPHRL